MNKPKVYIAGGFHSGFDDRAKEVLSDRWGCLLPKESGLKDKEWFTPLDLGLIETSKAVLLYAECENPGRNGWFEFGYAMRAHKHLVLAVEPGYYEAQEIPDRYIGMAIACADFYTRNMREAVAYLNRYAELNFPMITHGRVSA